MSQAAAVAQTPFDAIGGTQAVRRLAEAFYDRVATDPASAELRAMHDADMGPIKASLTGFLSAWLGGPRDWFSTHPGVCMMSIHRAMPITPATGEQWTNAMEHALRTVEVDPVLAEAMLHRFRAMADAMSRR
jgi:hemoglobin